MVEQFLKGFPTHYRKPFHCRAFLPENCNGKDEGYKSFRRGMELFFRILHGMEPTRVEIG